MQIKRNSSDEVFYLKRPRLHNLFMEAVNYPLVVICAGAGYGKTSAVNEFLQNYRASIIWIHISEKDNVGARFWENCANTVAKKNEPFAKAAVKLGFPDTPEKLKQFQTLLQDYVKLEKRILVLDDFHIMKEPSVIRFLEECILQIMPMETSVFLLSRSSPHINIASLVSKGVIFNIGENDLRFTENELARYFKQVNLSVQTKNLREIARDTEGWAFAINLVARSFQKAPGYSGYVRNAMKNNIFKLMETEIWETACEPFQSFLVRLSLIDHLSIELVNLLASGNKSLIEELEKQNAYIRGDSYINAYLIHHLFLEFLAEKQDMLSREQKRETYKIAGEWCNRNGFKIDALTYYEKIEDYESIVAILFAFPAQIPYDIAKYASVIIERIPQIFFDTVDFLAIMHISVYICQGLWEKAASLAKFYEAKFLEMPDNHFRKKSLMGLYHCWGLSRSLLCLFDDVYDFEIHFQKFIKHFIPPIDNNIFRNRTPGPWIISVGVSRKGSPQEFINSLTATTDIISDFFGLRSGEEELAKGELKYYQGDYHNAEIFVINSIDLAKKSLQYEVVFRAAFYLLRISIAQGDFVKAEKALNEIKRHLEESEYINRYINYDIVLGWYYCILGLPEKTPALIKDGFLPYMHPAFIENYLNQVKALYCYTTRNYPPILSYINDLKNREAYLFGRVEMLAMEACIHYKLKDKKQAASVLQQAYENAAPNNIVIPFIELGKDMRTLSSAVLKDSKSKIPKPWLENIRRKSASYAKYQVRVASSYKQVNFVSNGVALSVRETEILTDLSHGLSRAEIASTRELSINTVKMVINNVYIKLGAEGLADAIRIAAEKKIV